MTNFEYPIHHATLFIHPNRRDFSQQLWEELHPQSIAHTRQEHTVIDIENARAIIAWANTPYEGEKTMLLSFHTITIPAQNALLKILEEPRVGVKFILITSNKDSLIPTLLSRVQEMKTEQQASENIDQAILFLNTPYGERMKLPSITSLLALQDEEGRKDREEVRMFILSLATVLSQNKKASTSYAKEILTTLEMAGYAALPSSSTKNILEYLALLLPQLRD